MTTFVILNLNKQMDVKNNILETIGNTPMVQLNKVTKEMPCRVLMKVETFNPGHSIKDRMGLKMVLDAEADGRRRSRPRRPPRRRPRRPPRR